MPLVTVLAIGVAVAIWRTAWQRTPYDFSFRLMSRVLDARVLGPLPRGVAVRSLPLNSEADCLDDDPVCGRALYLIGPRGVPGSQLRDELVDRLLREGWQREDLSLFPGQVGMVKLGTAFAGISTAADEDAYERTLGGSFSPLPGEYVSGRGSVVVTLEYCGRTTC